jgi:hypothetical protein
VIKQDRNVKIELGKKLVQIRHEEESVMERIRDLEWHIEHMKSEGSLQEKMAHRHKAMDKLKYIRVERAKIETQLVEHS